MFLASLDAWARLLCCPRARIPARYWWRVGLCLAGSAFGTAVTLPERVVMAPVLWLAWRRRRGVLHEPGVLVVLGYHRSGTTHLHNLLASDPGSYTPKWRQTLAPAGFVLSWTLLKLLMTPFTPNRRTLDGMPFGPDWPAEDEFAINNWAAASTLSGMFVVPRNRGHYERYATLEGLTARERARWERVAWSFWWKISKIARRRRILLKSPTHTGRALAIADLVGPESVRFVHISREPEAVIRSNINMHRRMWAHALQPMPDDKELERIITEEYLRVEACFERDEAELGPGMVARVRYEDLVADPMGELARLHAELGIPWSERARGRAAAHLDQVADHRAEHQSGPGGVSSAEAIDPRLADLSRRFGHDAPPIGRGPMPGGPADAGTHRPYTAAVVTTVAMIPLWIGLVAITGIRLDTLVWPAGLMIGLGALRWARRGTLALGIFCGALTLVAVSAVQLPSTLLVGVPGESGDVPFARVVESSVRSMVESSTLTYTALGALTAGRVASRKHTRPPGA